MRRYGRHYPTSLAELIGMVLPALIRKVWRFWTGAHLDGSIRTDAGWWTRGTRVNPAIGHASAWAYRPRMVRAAHRWGGVLAAFVTLVGLANYPGWTILLWAAALLAGLALLVRRVWLSRQRKKFDAEIVRPLYWAIAQILGVDHYPSDQMSNYLVVPMDYEENKDAYIRLVLPTTFTGDPKMQATISRVVSQKLGVELDGHWSHMGEPYVDWTHKPQPPQMVTYADIEPLIESASDGEAVIGLGTREETVSLHLDSETPHIGLNIGTGGGKSATLRGLIAQYRRQGAEIVIADVGVISLQEFEGVPGITILTKVEDIWFVIDRIQEEMERRYAEWQRNPKAKFRRIIFVLEEGNDFYLQSIAHWQEIKEKKDPATPPVAMKLAQLLVKARKVKIHFLGVYQNMDAKAVGVGSLVAGPLIRAQLGMKILARFTPQAWAFLVGTSPRPKSSRHIGRAIVMIGDDMRVTQMAYWTPEEARAVALGDETPVSVTSAEIVDHLREEARDVTPVTARPSLRVVKDGETGPAQETRRDTTNEAPSDAPNQDEWTTNEGSTIPSPPRQYTLAEAARDEVVPMSYGALRQAKSQAAQRGLAFPDGRLIHGKTMYTASELQDWYSQRQSKASGDQ